MRGSDSADLSVEVLGVLRRVVVLANLLQGFVLALRCRSDIRATRDGLGVPGLGIPQLRAEESLRAMEEGLLHGDLHDHGGPVFLDLELVGVRRVGQEAGASVDPQGVAASWHQKQQAHMWICLLYTSP